MRLMQLQDLIALNDEILALSRAGVPLAQGLVDVGSELPRRFGQIAESVGRRMKKGQTLEAAIADCSADVPPAYRAVVAAGIRSGNLTAAVSGLATSLRQRSEVCRMMERSCYYPLSILFLATISFALVMRRAIGHLLSFVDSYDWLNFRWTRAWLQLLSHHGNWVILLPIAAVLIWWVLRRRNRQTTARQPDGLRLLSRWIPGYGQLIRMGKLANFTNVLSLLFRHDVPLPQALPLAADAVGDAELMSDAHKLSERLAAGSNRLDEVDQQRGIPAILAWLLVAARTQSQLVSVTEKLSDQYREAAEDYAYRLTTVVPVVMSVGLAAAICLVYALSFSVPWYYIMLQLTQVERW